MRIHRRTLFAACLFAVAVRLFGAPGGAVTPPDPRAFREGDRWCVVGDSITHSGTYHQWVALYWLTRHPERALDVFNCGVSGDTAAGGLTRFDWDILVHRPTVASVMFGMNDVTRTLYSDAPVTPEIGQKRRERLDAYQKNQRELVARLQRAGVRVMLVTPTPFDQTAAIDRPKQTGVNEALGECAAFLRHLADETGATVVDFYGPMNHLSAALQAKDPAYTFTRGDRVHPTEPWHLVMAYLFLKAQGATPDVARLSLDATTATVTNAINGRVENLRRTEAGLAFSWAESALPFPIDPTVAPALAWVPFIAELNQEVLQITGLAAGRYELRIDGTAIAAYSADELAHGVNLATETTTPQYQQALAVAALLAKQRELVASDLRGIALIELQAAPNVPHPLFLEQMQPYLEKRRETFKQKAPAAFTLEQYERYPERKQREAASLVEAAQLAAEARRAAVPRPHTLTLTRLP
jgi:lysophospholipase L1-like esterase